MIHILHDEILRGENSKKNNFKVLFNKGNSAQCRNFLLVK